ncbi:MAG TPA: alpha/beta fold hydrolase [Acidimicrobiales bacterium]|nr:alpha/beta fold hydrolase [Acidimicrobiales bacterium]
MHVIRWVPGAGVHLGLLARGDDMRPTVVLIHGFPDTSAVWNPLAELLASDFHVVAYDVRGAGHSDVPRRRADYALPKLVDDLECVLDEVSPGAPVHLVAHDWGSIQAWEAVTTERLAGRFASFTSISGPPIDHAALWARTHRSWRSGALWPSVRQALRSWYILFFHLPLLPKVMARGKFNQKLWARALHRVEGAPTDEDWPASTFGADFGHGVELYRANMLQRFRHPAARHTETPVQLIVPRKDRYVTPPLLDGLRAWTSLMWRREVDAGHWVVRTHPAELAGWVREVIAYIEDGTESDALKKARMR